jgi:hypothetical protein
MKAWILLFGVSSAVAGHGDAVSWSYWGASNAAISCIPEPATFAVAGIGLALAFLTRRELFSEHL